MERYFFFGLLLATLVFAFYIFRPFWIVLVLGVSFSVVLYPGYEWLRKMRLPNWLASLLTVLVFLVVLCGPVLGIGAIVFNQSQNLFHQITTSGNISPSLDTINTQVNNLLPNGVTFNIDEKISEFVSFVSNNIANIFSTTVSAFFSFLLMLLIMFYCLKDGAKWKKTLIQISPLGEENDEKILDKLSLAVNGVIRGSLLISMIQGILLGIGFWIFHIPNAALWGVVAAVFSLIPTFGIISVSAPAIIFLFIKGHTLAAVGLLAWLIVTIGTIDNLLGPHIVGHKIHIPSILILFSVLGAISLVGPVGVLIGPLTLSLLFVLVAIYKNEFK